MILESAALQVKPGETAAFEAAFREAQAIIASAPGYRWHELQRCVEREGHYLLLVRWDSVAAHEEGFRKSPAYEDWKRLLHHFYDPFPEVLHYERVQGGIPGEAEHLDFVRVRQRSERFFARAVGVLAVSAGAALALLAAFFTYEAFKRPAGVALALAGLVIGLAAVFCLVVGGRLTFDRRNRYGSILSPGAWVALGIVFTSLGLAVGVFVALHGYSHALFVMLAAGAFAAACFGLARKGRK